MRVLHLPTAVGGGPTGLSQQLNALGIESEVWSIDQNYLNYPVDRAITDAQEPLIVQMLKVLRAGAYVFGPWDVVHFNYGSTLFSNGGKLLSMREGRVARRGVANAVTFVLGVVSRVLQGAELGILRARGIPVFVHYQGDDARQGDYSLANFEVNIATQVPPGFFTPKQDRWKRRQIRLMAGHAAAIYAVNPDLLNILPPSAEFVPYGNIPIHDWEPRYPLADGKPLVFAHAPSNRSVKGTALILDALAELKAEGYVFELDLVEGMDNHQALTHYRDADVLIDQLFAGWYGGVAVEAMALGKPVVVYLRESDFQFLPEGMAQDLPFFRAAPTTIKETLRAILDMPRSELVDRAKKSRAFVERWHDPVAITAKIADDYARSQKSTKRRSGTR